MEVSRPPRIGLLGEFGVGNLGNEGSLTAILGFLGKAVPDADLVCICRSPRVASEVHGIPAIEMKTAQPRGALAKVIDRVLLGVPSRIRNLAHAVIHASRLDVLLVPGTGALDDFGQTPSDLPYDLFRWCLAARLWGCKIGFVSVGAGPIHHPVSRALMLAAARLAHYRSYRDIPSRNFMAKVGLGRPLDPLFPDLAFGLPAPSPVPREEGAPLTVAVGLMTYYGWSGRAEGGEGAYRIYLEKITDFICWLLQTGRRVRLVTGDDVDARAVEDVYLAIARCAPAGISMLEPFTAPRDLSELMSQLAAADVVVATRFHNVVCALGVGRPTISLGYAAKNVALLNECGLGALAQDVDDFDLARLKSQTEQLLADRERLATNIKRHVAVFRDRLKLQEKILKQEFFAEHQ